LPGIIPDFRSPMGGIWRFTPEHRGKKLDAIAM
jgi:hypothetical protein